MASRTPEQPQNGTAGDGHGDGAVIRRQVPPFFPKLLYAGSMYGLQTVLGPLIWLREWREARDPPEERPDIIKAYECRPALPIRIFFPASYDQTSTDTLPTLFTIHGGGFCVGHQRDDDEWNRAFADKHHALVIALNYSKAPAHPFPTAPHDVEALLLAALADASLPIDRGSGSNTTPPKTAPKTALLGFSAGGNLALAVSQLPRIRTHPLAPAAVISVYGCLDLSYPPQEKLRNRPWKPSLAPPRGAAEGKDALIGLAPAFDWSYIPYGQDLRDPLLSPLYAGRGKLPGYVCVVAAELDMLAHESWRMACRLSREGGNVTRVVPDRGGEEGKWRVCGSVEGRLEVGKGELIGLSTSSSSSSGEENNEDGRYAFEESWEGGGVKWLLVPDVLHGFDNPHLRVLTGGEETIEDAVLKTEVYRDEVARWLKEVVWRV